MKILAFTGAGISKQSNIPTFMERPDVREKLFRTFAEHHHEAYNEVIRELKANMNGAEPNDAHFALAEYKVPVITMNIDGLHKKSGAATHWNCTAACRRTTKWTRRGRFIISPCCTVTRAELCESIRKDG